MTLRVIGFIWAALSGTAACMMIKGFVVPGTMQYDLDALPFIAIELTAFVIMARLMVKGIK